MTVQQLLNELQRRGVEIEADGRRLLLRPVDAIGAELIPQLQAHKAELLALVTEAPPALVVCPWCRAGLERLAEGASGRLWCLDCQRAAWLPVGEAGFVRADVKDWPEVEEWIADWKRDGR